MSEHLKCGLCEGKGFVKTDGENPMGYTDVRCPTCLRREHAAEIAKLLAALAPFAAVGEYLSHEHPDNDAISLATEWRTADPRYRIPVGGDYRRAAEVRKAATANPVLKQRSISTTKGETELIARQSAEIAELKLQLSGYSAASEAADRLVLDHREARAKREREATKEVSDA